MAIETEDASVRIIEPEGEPKGMILCVEDHEKLRKFTTRLLLLAGYAIIPVADGKPAFNLLKEGKIQPDLMITDQDMPAMHGSELILNTRELEKERGTTPIPIIWTSMNDLTELIPITFSSLPEELRPIFILKRNPQPLIQAANEILAHETPQD